MSVWLVLAQGGLLLAEHLLENQRIQEDLSAGRISEDEAWRRLRETQKRYARTREGWDDAGDNTHG